MKSSSWLRLLVLLLIVAGIGVSIAFREQINVQGIREFVRADGSFLLSLLVFIGIYTIATVFWLPATPFSLAGGAMFGWGGGIVGNLTGSAIGATCAFLIARYIAADKVRHAAGKRGQRIIEGVEHEGWRFVVFVRLIVFIPFNLVNYALGVTRIPLASYVVATVLGMLHWVLAYSYLGHAFGEMMGGADTRQAFFHGFVALTLLVVAAMVPRLWLMSRIRRISPDSLRATGSAADVPTVMLDLRPADEASETPIVGATHIPANDLYDRLDELADVPRTSRLALLTVHGGFAMHIIRTLKAAGFDDIAIVRGGATEWRASDASPAHGVASEPAD